MSTTHEPNAQPGRRPAWSQPYRAQDPNERRAWRKISRAVQRARRSGTPIDTATARLIAATAHGGPGSALERFAATGELSVRDALLELEMVPMGTPPARWLKALADYCKGVDTDEEHPRGAA